MVLVVLLSVQSLAAVFFLGDVLVDLTLERFGPHVALEGAVALALVLGVVFGAREVRRTIERANRSETALAVAQGALADLISGRFEEWRLTPAESEVALLALKGFDTSEIAVFRHAASGTVRAQLARIYAKAGVTNRTQLVALFMDDLLDGGIAHGPVSDG